ncbi:MAG: cell division protein SepF [Bacilli bacterium]|nr:cell division protein SepF [Bacilli bacterium]
MGVFDKILGKEELGETTSEDEFYTLDVQEAYRDNNSEGNKMILLEPRAYSESQQIADHLKKRNTVVVNLKRVTAEQAKRIVDFLSGTLYAIGGDLQKLGSGIFLCTPKNINVQGKMTDEEEKKTKTKNDDVDL